jgi:hypothetical protein
VQCTQDSSKTATGIEIATGTGDLFGKNDNGYPIAFLLIIIPVTLLILAFTNKSFAILRNISIAGLLAKITFLIYSNWLLNSGNYKGAFELTGFNWLVLTIYIGLCVFTFYCVKELPNSISTFENESIQNASNINSSQINVNQNSSGVNYLLISGIIGSLIIVLIIIGNIIFSLVLFREHDEVNISQAILNILINLSDIRFIVGLFATIINFIYLVKNKIIFLLIAGVGYCISVLFTILSIYSIFIWNSYFNIIFILWNLTFFLIVPAIICILEFIKNKKKNM